MQLPSQDECHSCSVWPGQPSHTAWLLLWLYCTNMASVPATIGSVLHAAWVSDQLEQTAGQVCWERHKGKRRGSNGPVWPADWPCLWLCAMQIQTQPGAALRTRWQDSPGCNLPMALCVTLLV